MNDEELGMAWTAIEPTTEQRRRINGRVLAWLDAHDTALVAEWLGLFRAAPFAALGLAAAGAVAIVASPPVIWFARALM